MSATIETPRVVYRGKPDESAETVTVADQDALAAALKDGYRLQRNPKVEKAPVAASTVRVAAQDLKVVPDGPAASPTRAFAAPAKDEKPKAKK